MTTTLDRDLTLKSLPDEARVWIYAADRELNELEENRVKEILDTFCLQWESHGRPVESASDVREGRFAIIAGYVEDGDVSGCGIDKSVHALEKASSELAFEWLPGLAVHYRDEKGVPRSTSRQHFRSLVREGVISSATPVFDFTIETVGQLRSGEFERPAGESWHARVFRISESAP